MVSALKEVLKSEEIHRKESAHPTGKSWKGFIKWVAFDMGTEE